MSEFRLVTHSAAQTERLGRHLAQALRGGDVLALDGDLGAGKTTLVRGLADGLRIDPALVKSPTYVLMHEYPGPNLPMIHIDAYRIEGRNALNLLDTEWWFHRRKFTVIEWAERVEPVLPAQTIHVHLAYAEENSRELTFSGESDRSAAVCAQIKRWKDEDETC